MKRIIKGGRVVSSHGVRMADIRIEDGIIKEVGEISQQFFTEDCQVTDASGMLIFPGFIDVHTHFDLHVAGTVTADDFYTGTKAAILGGTTTIVDFATQYPGETLMEGLSNWHKKADGKCSCDYGFHMSITDWNPETSREIETMMEEGVSTFKLYMTYDTQVDDKTIYQILKRLDEEGGMAGVHCENSGLIEALQEEAVSQGRMGVASHPATRPAGAEAEAISRLLRLAEAADAPVMVVHLTCEEGLKEIRRARKRGQVQTELSGVHTFQPVPLPHGRSPPPVLPAGTPAGSRLLPYVLQRGHSPRSGSDPLRGLPSPPPDPGSPDPPGFPDGSPPFPDTYRKALPDFPTAGGTYPPDGSALQPRLHCTSGRLWSLRLAFRREFSGSLSPPAASAPG